MSVIATPRKGLIHFNAMKPSNFIDWVIQSKGTVQCDTKVRLKLDGFNLKFGKDSTGDIFIEGARTGPIFEHGVFLNYAKSKTQDPVIIQRAMHYEDILRFFKNSDIMDLIPNDCKIDCEMFYNPMAVDHGYELQFVTVKYDKSKLGTMMSIAPYSIMDSLGNEHQDSTGIFAKLIGYSNSEVRLIDPNLEVMGNIDISNIIAPIEYIKSGALRSVINSRKACDKEYKNKLHAEIKVVQDSLYHYLMFHENLIGLDAITDRENNEGTVWFFNDGVYKMTSDSFKHQMKNKNV